METDLSPEQFSLKWNNFSNNLTSGFISHLTEQDLVDVTLAVEGQLLQAHKLVLSVCSPYFKSIFKENPCQHPVIILKDMKHAEIEMLLKFMYQGEVNVRQEDLSTFLTTAQALQIKGLTGGENKEILLSENDFYELCENSEIEDVTTHSYLNASKSDKVRTAVDTPKRRRDETKRHTYKKRRSSSPVLSNSTTAAQEEETTQSEEIITLLNDDMHDSSISSECLAERSHEESYTSSGKDEMDILANVQHTGEKSTQSVVEPVIYRLSARGRPQLVHEGYVYNLTSRSEILNRSHYRCAEQHRGCRGKCAVIAERFMPTGVHDHNHPPGYQSEYDYKKKKAFETDST